MQSRFCYGLLLALLVGCAGKSEVAPERVAAGAVLVEAADARRCDVTASARATPFEQAVWCAEKFVEQNGYTTRAAADHNKWSPEAGEEGRLVEEIRARRRGTLRPDAIVVCRGTDERARATYAVGFASAENPPSPTGRAVTMDSVFADLRVRSGGFPLITALGDTVSCRSTIR